MDAVVENIEYWVDLSDIGLELESCDFDAHALPLETTLSKLLGLYPTVWNEHCNL